MEPCIAEKRIEISEKRHDGLVDSIKKMEDKFDAKLDMILYQINKVAVLEEKHTYQSTSLERAFSKIQHITDSIDALNSFKDRTEGMAKMAWIIWAAMGASILGMLAKISGS